MAEEEEKEPAEAPVRVLSQQEEEFITAVQEGNLDLCKSLLMKGVDINFLDESDSTPLFHCCTDKLVDIARWMLGQGARVNHQNKRGTTPLHVACQRRNKEAMLLLLLNGADPNLPDVDNRKPEEMNPSIKPMVTAVSEERTSFASVTDSQKRKLSAIFDEIDNPKTRNVDAEKSARFNRYMEDITEDAAMKDAVDFIRDVSICKRDLVNLEEWMLAFGKLAVDKGVAAVDDFIEEYEKKVKEKGKYVDFLGKLG